MFVRIFIPRCLTSTSAYNPINKPFSGEKDDQIIPQSPDYVARFAGYITLCFGGGQRVKLIGSKTEKDYRDELLASHEFHFSMQPRSRLKESLQQAGYGTDNAYVLHWTPDQSVDFFTVLVDRTFLVAVEIDRYEVEIEPIVKRHELTAYLKGLSRMHQVRFLVAQELANGKHNGFVEWTHNGGQRGRHSSMLSAPLSPIHGQR